MKKNLAILLLVLMLLSCTPVLAEEPVVLTALWNSAGTQMNEENSVMKAIEEATGIRLQCSSSAEYNTKLSTLIASNSLPDMFSSYGDQAIQLRDNGYLLDMAPYLKEFAPKLWAELEPTLMMSPLNTDGKVYGIMSAATWYPSSLAVRTDYLAKVGKEIPTTIDEFYDVLYDFTFKDPDGDGQQNTYGIAYAMCDLFFVPTSYFAVISKSRADCGSVTTTSSLRTTAQIVPFFSIFSMFIDSFLLQIRIYRPI